MNPSFAGRKGIFGQILPFEDFQGLSPQAWICVGAGFSREDVKAWLLSNQVSFVGETVQTFPALCQKIVATQGELNAESVLSSPGRQEVLRLLLSVPGVREKCPELNRLKRQGTFLRRLDHAIQAGRMSFAHWEEAEVYSERLAAKQGENPVRQEVERLARAYESWLEASGLWDPILVTRKATEILGRLGSEDKLKLPDKIYYLCGQTQESLEKSFWEAMSPRTQVILVQPQDFKATEQASFQWERWHTLDDSAERLADLLSEKIEAGAGLSNTVVLISDVPSARRTLKRAFSQRGIQLGDPRDPTRIRWDETIKWAMLPLEAVARGFERTRVIPLIHQFKPEFQSLIPEIGDRGIRNGLRSYSGGKLSSLHQWLSSLNSRLGGKKTVGELAEAHLRFLSEVLESSTENFWVYGFFEQIWKQTIQDLARVDLTDRRAALLYWLERLQSRVSEAPSPVERLKPLNGLDVYRLHQAPSNVYEQVICFGLPALWFSGEGLGDYWFSEREREILSTEFSVRSGIQIRQERVHALKAWFSGAREVIFLDALYETAGRERESIQGAIEEIAQWDTGLPPREGESPDGAGLYALPEEPVEQGSHSRWTESYGALRPMSPQSIELPPLTAMGGEDKPSISASALENYSRCGFLALARQRWRLEDLSEPDTDLWPHVKGILLHEAVRVLVESRDEVGNFSKTAEEAVETAWAAKRPKGLLQGARIESYVKRKLVILLRTFQEQERKYVQRSKTKVLALENVDFKVSYPSFTVVGEPDRIDEHPDGLWIIDYKTSSQAPNGSTMLENGYRLQLPFYALASQKHFGKSALGFQFVQLDRKGTRTNGVYFKDHNGKDPGCITDTTARSKSLLTVPREEVWSRFEEQIQELGAQYVAGKFEARPRISPRGKECDSCGVSDFCGYRRILDDSGDQDGGSE
jgi:RecB family exonuclease